MLLTSPNNFFFQDLYYYTVLGGVLMGGLLNFQVLHPKNPFAPTLHFNYRYFETDAPKGIYASKF
jgi:hypothetical protein